MKIFLLLALLAVSTLSNAAKLGDLDKYGTKSTGNSIQVGAWSSGKWDSAIPIPPTPGGWAYAGNYGIPQTPTGQTMNMGHSGDVFFSGTKYPFQAGYQVPGTTIVDAIGAVAGGPVGIGLFALPFVLNWLTDSGARVDPLDPSKLQREASNVVCDSNSESVNGVCRSYVRWCAGGYGKKADMLDTCAPGSFIESINEAADTFYIFRPVDGYAVPCSSCITTVQPLSSSTYWESATFDDISPYMKAKPFDPRVVSEILSKGVDIPLPAPTVTGPSEILGPKTETLNPDGTKTVSQPKRYFTPSGDTITNTKNETTVTVINVDNSVQSSTVTTTTPVDAEKPEDFCLANPDRIGCAKFGEAPESENLEKQTVPVIVTPVNFGSAAGCPAPLSRTLTLMGHPVAFSVSYQPLCDQLAILRALFLVMAAFLSAYVLADSFKVT